MLLDPMAPEAPPEPEWKTGTAIDEFTAVYRVLAHDQYNRKGVRIRPGMTPADVDRMDIAAVAVLMGVGVDHGAAELAELEEIARARAAGDDDTTWGGEDLSAFRRPPT